MESFLLRFGDAEPHLLEQIKGNSIKNSKKKKRSFVEILKFWGIWNDVWTENPPESDALCWENLMQGMALKLMFRKPGRAQSVQNL